MRFARKFPIYLDFRSFRIQQTLNSSSTLKQLFYYARKNLFCVLSTFSVQLQIGWILMTDEYTKHFWEFCQLIVYTIIIYFWSFVVILLVKEIELVKYMWNTLMDISEDTYKNTGNIFSPSQG